MATELSKTYDPKAFEKDVYAAWQAAGVFHADPAAKGKSYSIVIPPPNVTAALHLGHALNNTLQDVLVRWRRMQQYKTLWMPGTDHAGIATQTVVDKRLLSDGEGGLAKYRQLEAQGQDGRTQFIAKVQAWKDEYEARILGQLQLMGCSCDWDRKHFTMDPDCSKAVRAAFFKLFADGLIYRGKRLVNWDPATQTVLADDEVEHEDVKGAFWYLKYPLVNGRTGVSPVDMLQTIHTGETPVLPAFVTVATTRPETMLGDTAVAMNPADPRAKYLVGQKVRLPIVGREIPIIADEHVVLPNPESDDEKAKFSTGFLKVTPAHDPDDWAIGQRHNLPVINIMAPDGSISDKHGWTDSEQVKNSDLKTLIGMDRFKARKTIEKWFDANGLLEKKVDYTHPVGHSYRSHVPIEPYLSDQWYIAVKKPIAHCPLPIANWAEKHPELVEAKDDATYLKGTDVPVNSLAGFALMPLLDGGLKFTPDRYAKTYQTWLENLRDWPISRQLWWGHRIPVWTQDLELPADVAPTPTDRGPDAQTCAACDAAIGGKFGELMKKFPKLHYYITIDKHPDRDGWIRTFICMDHDEPKAVALVEKAGWVRDTDVLDTWFSSGLWPISTMGWPEETELLKAFYPTDVLCTAREIITLWVSRMVMFGQYFRGASPFHDVYIHAMIQDGDGRKMSKSLGNGIDPLDIIDSHGADAMRFTLVSMTTQTQDVRMPVAAMKLPDGRTVNSSQKFDLSRNFCNKLWNAARFAMMNLEGAPAWADIRPSEHLADRWILSRLNSTIRDATRSLESFRFSELADTLYHFAWDDFCDWYLEIAKGRINAGQPAPKAILAHCLDVLLRLLHPIAPFITEAIWGKLNEVAAIRGPGDSPAEPILAKAAWPHADSAAIVPGAEEEFATLQEIVRQIRNVRKEHNIPPSQVVDVVVEADGRIAETLSANVELLKSQAQLGQVKMSREVGEPPHGAAALTVGGAKIYVLDIIDATAERARLTKQAETMRKGIAGIEAKLSNESFIAKAPPAVVQKERQRLEGIQRDLSAVEKSLASLG